MKKLTFRLESQPFANQNARGAAEVAAREVIQVAGGDPEPARVVLRLMALAEMPFDQLAQSNRRGILANRRPGLRGVDAGQVDQGLVQRRAERVRGVGAQLAYLALHGLEPSGQGGRSRPGERDPQCSPFAVEVGKCEQEERIGEEALHEIGGEEEAQPIEATREPLAWLARAREEHAARGHRIRLSVEGERPPAAGDQEDLVEGEDVRLAARVQGLDVGRAHHIDEQFATVLRTVEFNRSNLP